MLVESCCAEEILNLNKNKEYTLISTDLLERVLTDTRLNAQTVKLWQILFNKAKYKKDLSTKMSYSYLSKMLNKSVRTIIRYSKTLVKSGYLKIETNFDESGSQRSNTFLIRVPEIFIQSVKEKKNRATAEKTNIKANQSSVTTSELRQAIDLEINSEINSKNLIAFHDKIDTGEGDNTVIHNNSFKENNKNNKEPDVVVSLSPNNDTLISEMEKEVSQLNEIINQEWITFSKLVSSKQANSMDHHEKIRNLESKRDSLKLKIDIEKSKIKAAVAQMEQSTQLSKDPSYYLNHQGDRQISKSAFTRMIKNLEQCGFSSDKLNQITNEIVYEARFGSLTLSKQTRKELHIENSLNIALKLVKEGRWNTPVALRDCI